MSVSGHDGGPAGGPLEAEWLAAFRRIVTAQRELFSGKSSIAARTVYEGVGEGGDRALAIDRQSEDIIFEELERIAADGHALVAISEERGELGLGSDGPSTHVVVDPLDGSLNARRMLPSFAVSIAVASGPTMADVELGYVYDFGAGEEFVARRGGGAVVNGEELRAQGPGFGLEVVGVESAKPERTLPLLEGLAGKAYRIRAIGSIAISLSYVAGGRFDAMLTGRPCRSVDAAAGQLIVREAGATVAFGDLDLETAPLGLDARYHVAAALDDEMLKTVLEAQEHAEPVEEPRS